MPKDLVALGLIKNETDSIVEVSQTEDSVSYVADEEHYTEVFKRMTEVKRSLKIATANLKNFSVFIDSAGREETLRLCDFFMSLVERGVHVQVVCMKPFGFYLYTKNNCPQLLENPLFELRYNGRNHMKVFVFDDALRLAQYLSERFNEEIKPVEMDSEGFPMPAKGEVFSVKTQALIVGGRLRYCIL